MHGVVKKWGNSAAVRIPAAVLETTHLRLEQPMNVREEDGRIIIEPLQPAHDDLDALVAAITEDNRHDPVETGKPTGREVC